MKLIAVVLAPGFALAALAVSAATSPATSSVATPAAPAAMQQAEANVFRTVDKCTPAGCVITCKNIHGAWERIDQAAMSITTVNYPSGNVRFLLDDGNKGKRTLVYGPSNLACTITGHE
ncbi:hypothetical protein [Undibacterium sp.]|uniref:hypothetical protein n=1 Tax=Undibacterium sp. TaxID=1914977 RepID=UPI00374D64F8